jgi:hypothetical protein
LEADKTVHNNPVGAKPEIFSKTKQELMQALKQNKAAMLKVNPAFKR